MGNARVWGFSAARRPGRRRRGRSPGILSTWPGWMRSGSSSWSRLASKIALPLARAPVVRLGDVRERVALLRRCSCVPAPAPGLLPRTVPWTPLESRAFPAPRLPCCGRCLARSRSRASFRCSWTVLPPATGAAGDASAGKHGASLSRPHGAHWRSARTAAGGDSARRAAPGIDVQAAATRVARFHRQRSGRQRAQQVDEDPLDALLVEFGVVAEADQVAQQASARSMRGPR